MTTNRTSELLKMYNDYSVNNHYQKSPDLLMKAVSHIMSMPGKKIRPLLTLTACEAFKGNINYALPAAHAVEYFHNFTLVHDDIMDDSKIRRGIDCVHVKFGVNQAILAGDAMFPYAYSLLQLCPKENFMDLFSVFNETAMKIMDGQQWDVEFENRSHVNEAEYEKMIAYKTSVLLACSLELGAIISGANVEDRKHIYNFGLKLGLAFQIKDDWLDTFGDEKKVGKKIGGDILNNKKTFLLVSAINKADENQLKKINYLISQEASESKISQMTSIFEDLNIPEETENKMLKYYNDSLNSLTKINTSNFDPEPLKEIAKQIFYREH
jgi:geranylgeranyl diphosphate synthase, type II